MRAEIRKLAAIVILLLTIAAVVYFRTSSRPPELCLERDRIAVYFSPHGGCTEAIVEEIDKARSEILVQAYSLTSATIAKSLLRAHRRGVKTEVILDRSQRSDRYSSASFLAHQQIPVYIDAEHAVAHNKVIVIDQKVVITGSFNFTRAAEEKNAENLLIIRSEGLAREYRRNWQLHKQHSQAYQSS
jgi:phosphatidylserine/phosphatidylglycerophosphate/cardiolipin synthase-like enzyme